MKPTQTLSCNVKKKDDLRSDSAGDIWEFFDGNDNGNDKENVMT